MKRIWTKHVTLPDEPRLGLFNQTDWNESEWYWADENAPCELCDRGGQSMAKQAFNTSQTTASQYGSQAATERSQVQRYDTANLINPQGFGQQGVKEMLTAALGGAGGATSAIEGEEDLGAKRGTTGPNSAVLDDVARQGAKAGAKASETIAAEDVTAKLGQKQDAANDLSRRYGIDVGAQLGAMGQQAGDVNAEVNASSHGWLQDLETFTGQAAQVAGAAL